MNFEKKYIDKVIQGDSLSILKEMPNDMVDLVVTSPPYFQQRDYGNIGIGNEKTVEEYIRNLILIFEECVRVTKPTGSIVFNVGDKYINGNLLLVPYRFAIEAQKNKDLRLVNELTWVKVNPTPKQDTRKLISSKEPFFIFAKSNDYYFDKNAFLEYKDMFLNGNQTRNRKDVGKRYFELIENSNLSVEEKRQAKKELTEVILEVKSGKLESFRMKIRDIHALPYGGQAGGRLTQIQNKGFTIIKIYGNSIRKDIIESTVETIKGNQHPAVYPEFVVQELIKLLTPQKAIVLDPFLGSGTTAVVAKKLQRNYIGIEIYDKYVEYAKERINEISQPQMQLFL
ncbi:MAG TPA: site-specific DNA-methyltransferase [Paludibacteraceae bacterium]|jgi:site-specific DNA-methyltransferase (adenine-specific)|nr:site-specific DNA-methyltransferase [Paludibacteraceae bacterium]HOD88853.1 site-specific DNA-methyltransferase [Bacteroidales bacterium]